MKINELLEGNPNNVPKDGKGNRVVWDPQRRQEVLVPERDFQSFIKTKQVIGGAFNLDHPTDPKRFPTAPGTRGYDEPDDSKGFVAGFKRGHRNTSRELDNLAYSKAAQVGKNVWNWVKDQSKSRS